jgi:hypothetical protein
VTPVSIYQELQAFFQTRKSDLTQLGSALQSGDLNAAQQAYQALVSLGQEGPFQNSAPFRNSVREQDFQAIGQALQNGDLAGAQAAFAQLEATFHHGGNSTQNTATDVTPAVIINIGTAAASGTTASSTGTTSNTSSASSTGTNSATTGTNGAVPEVVINLGNNSGAAETVTMNFSNNANGGEQLTISATQGNGNPEQVTLNFPQNSNEQIVLNLLNSVASTSSTANGGTVSASA